MKEAEMKEEEEARREDRKYEGSRDKRIGQQLINRSILWIDSQTLLKSLINSRLFSKGICLSDKTD